MLAWLGEWLQSIVVVVLLAIVVELVLPNSKMLRYSRLVVGLILLLTMLNPILQIFQVDFQDKLNASFSLWEKQMKSEQSGMPSLEQITQDGNQLKQQREKAALDVTRASLEQAMLQELNGSVAAKVGEVAVQLGWSKAANQQELPFIDSVTITIAPPQEQSPSDEVEGVASIDIEEVSIPAIKFEGDEGQVESDSAAIGQKGQHEPSEQWEAQFNRQAQEIIAVIAARWNVKANHIFVQASN